MSSIATKVTAKDISSFDITIEERRSDNLFQDSSGLSDTYSVRSFTANFYPVSPVSVALSLSHTYYQQTTGLSNLSSTISATYIPFDTDSRLSIYLNGSLNGRLYGSTYNGIDANRGNFIGSASYRITDYFRVRTGFRFTSTHYTNSSFELDPNTDETERYGGINLTLPGNVSLDVEFGQTRVWYIFVDGTLEYIPGAWNPGLVDEAKVVHKIRSTFISPRISRSLGRQTGLSITYTHRSFSDIGNALLLADVVGNLSPWASVFEGNSIIFRAKTYVIPSLITTVGFSYAEKEYFPTLDDKFGSPVTDARERSETLRRFFMEVKRPVRFGRQSIVDVGLQIEKTDNNSTHALYGYESLNVALIVNVRP